MAFDRQAIADHANTIVSKQREALIGSLKRLGVDTIHGWGRIAGQQKGLGQDKGWRKGR